MKLNLSIDGVNLQIECISEKDFLTIKCNNNEYSVRLDDYKRGIRTILVNNRRIKFGWKKVGDMYRIVLSGIEYEVNFSRNFDFAVSQKSADSTDEEVKITAPIPGLVVDVKKEIGKPVKKGECVIILSAMKLENEIPSPRDGIVKNILVKRGNTVAKNDVLVVIV